MSWFSRILRRLIPEDLEPGCGYGPFKLDSNHAFTRGCNLHDFDFGEAHRVKEEYELGKDQVDSNLAYRWMLIARAEPDPRKQCELIMDLCRWWPVARRGGSLMWDGR